LKISIHGGVSLNLEMDSNH